MSAPINDGGPAFAHAGQYSDGHRQTYEQPGMSLRAYFVGQLISGLGDNPGDARVVVAWADVLIAELAKTK